MVFRKRQRSRRRRRSVHKLIAVGGGLFLGLVVAEIGVRALYLQPTYNVIFARNYRLSKDPLLEYELVPGSPDGESVINSHGLRNAELSVVKPPGVFRVAVIGDSVTYGLWCPRERSYPQRLQALLQRCADHDAPLDYATLCAIIEAHPQWLALNRHVRQKSV